MLTEQTKEEKGIGIGRIRICKNCDKEGGGKERRHFQRNPKLFMSISEHFSLNMKEEGGQRVILKPFAVSTTFDTSQVCPVADLG